MKFGDKFEIGLFELIILGIVIVMIINAFKGG